MNDGMNMQGPSNDDYETPPWLFKALDAEFGFTFDAAANEKNALCDRWGPRDTERFGERVFCNPPYSNVDLFVDRAMCSKNLWILLLPSRTDTRWFQSLMEEPRASLRFFRKRVRFCLDGQVADSPRFGSVVAVIKPR